MERVVPHRIAICLLGLTAALLRGQTEGRDVQGPAPKEVNESHLQAARSTGTGENGRETMGADNAAAVGHGMNSEGTGTTEDPARLRTVLELQVELHRRGFSCGSIDGVIGGQTVAALRAFQRSTGIAETGRLDAVTREHLELSDSPLLERTLTPGDIGAIHPVPTTWLEKSQLATLAYGSILELIAERYHAHPKLIQRLNPSVKWSAPLPGTTVIVPAVENVTVTGTPAQIVISLAARELEVLDDTSRVIAHFPVSIAHAVEKRPVGELHIAMLIPNPDYTFDPAVFTESAEGRELGRKLVVPPGPNNPVGLAWIALDRPGYGIHGTPEPEHVGRTESHGCFRLANWDVLTLLQLVHVGMTVLVEP